MTINYHSIKIVSYNVWLPLNIKNYSLFSSLFIYVHSNNHIVVIAISILIPIPSVDVVVNYTTNSTNDSRFFYEKTTAHIDNTRASLKNSTPTHFFTKRTVLYEESMFTYRYDTKSTKPIRNVHYVRLLNENLCQIDRLGYIPYKTRNVVLCCFFWFFEFFQENIVYIVQAKISTNL